ncbi:MAG TPA: exopolysaccharide biosynthesis polyprenyl glycosylphosphotransferase [Patescibacteria group bacterium]|nr:exopolysaccharide biosynthesis polyprenyl glycosylphosphotransferase [Patescibacteria group bacterium]
MSGFNDLLARRRAAAAVLFLGDAAALSLCTGLAVALLPRLEAYFGDSVAANGGSAVIASLISAGAIAYFGLRGHYSRRTLWWQQMAEMISASAAAVSVTALLAYSLQSWSFLAAFVLSWFTAPFILAAVRWLVRGALMRAGYWTVPTLVAGGAANGAKTVAALKAESYIVHDVVFHALPESGQAALPNGTYEYAVYCPDEGNAARDALMLERLPQQALRFGYVPPVEAATLYNASIKRFFGQGILSLEPAPRTTLVGDFVKGAVDRTGALIGLILLSPVFLALALVIRRDGGPVLFGHKRIGKNGRVFKCWKFRSMVPNAQEVLREVLERDPAARAEYERDFKLKNDPRVTRVGAILRKTSLDEIPQLFNVLRGEMSLMGPRPIVEDEKKFYEERISDYMSVKPGITGLWQVSGRSDTGYDQRVYLDSWYVRNRSFWNDMVIGLKTFVVVLARKGAY